MAVSKMPKETTRVFGVLIRLFDTHICFDWGPSSQNVSTSQSRTSFVEEVRLRVTDSDTMVEELMAAVDSLNSRHHFFI